jgi:hypothetical protein
MVFAPLAFQKTKPKIEGASIEEFAKTWAAAYR